MVLFISCDPFSFNYETEVNYQYWLTYLMPFFPILLIVKNFKIDYDFYRRFPVLCWSIVILYGLFIFSKQYSFPNEHYFVVFVMFCLFVTGMKLLTVANLMTVFYIIIPIYFYELFVGLRQMFGDNSHLRDPFAIKGTLFNSGIYACYVVTGLPFLYFFLFKNKSVYELNSAGTLFKLSNSFREWFRSYYRIIFAGKCIIFVCVFFYSIYAVYYTQSRTAIIALVVVVMSTIWLLYSSRIVYYVNRLSGWILMVSAISGVYLVGLAFSGLFYFKKLSAIGRLRGWTITCDHFTESFWFGTGLGRFTFYYPQWQAQYFKTHSAPPLEFFLSADESYIIFNEYLQLFKEGGIIGVFILLFLLIYFLRIRSSEHKNLLITVKTTVISIFACGFTSYPLHTTFFLLIITFCLLVGFVSRGNCEGGQPIYFVYMPLQKAFVVTFVVLSAVASCMGIQKAIAVEKWASLRNNYAYTREELNVEYATIYQSLYFDGKFLTEYGEYLLQNDADCLQAVKILEEAKKYFFTLRTMKAIGYAYWHLKNYSKAIETFEWMSYYMPNRFGLKYELLKLYKEAAEIDKARNVAKVILKMPVKIPSYEVDRIKSKTLQLLASL